MKVLVLYSHPVETSFNAALHETVVASLRAAGHEVDDCDLYAEGFSPVLTREERLGYHDLETNILPVKGYVDRVLAAEALVIVTPIWNFGWPAMLKGFFDRVFLPGISFKMVDGKVRPNLWNIRKFAVVCTYGGARWRALLMRDPPRKVAHGPLRVVMHPTAQMKYLALYDMNRATLEQRNAFREKVATEMAAF
jgi:NAD(P)H dehydrogenase (quinone)